MSAPNQPTTPDELAELIRQLTKHVELLWHAVDDLREEVFAEFAHRRGEPLDEDVDRAATPPFQLKSMPRDPCDPEFNKKTTTFETVEAAVPERPAATLDEFLTRLTDEPPTQELSSDNWMGDLAITPGVVLKIDSDIFDWFAESFDTEYETAKRHYVLADGEEWHYVLWSDEANCFVRRLTAAEEIAFGELSSDSNRADTAQAPGRAPNSCEHQGTLW